jgi:hypothetical protein
MSKLIGKNRAEQPWPPRRNDERNAIARLATRRTSFSCDRFYRNAIIVCWTGFPEVVREGQLDADSYRGRPPAAFGLDARAGHELPLAIFDDVKLCCQYWTFVGGCLFAFGVALTDLVMGNAQSWAGAPGQFYVTTRRQWRSGQKFRRLDGVRSAHRLEAGGLEANQSNQR